MKKILALIMAMAMVLSLAACGSSNTGSTDSSSGSSSGSSTGSETGTSSLPKDFTIAYAAVTTNLSPWTTCIANEMQAMCDRNGWNLIKYDGKGDVNTQTDQIASIISDKEADLVVLFPVSSDAGVTYVKDLTSAGFPVITLGSDVSSEAQSLVKCYVGPNQKDMVSYGAQYIMDKLGKDKLNYVILSGWQGQYDYITREQAVKDDFKDCSYNLLGVSYCGASRDTAMEEMTTYLNSNDNINFVFCLSDEFALGAIQAIDNAGKTGKITVVSMEAFKDGLTAIKDGKMSLSVTMTGASVVKKLESVIPSVMAGDKVDYYQASDTVRVTADNVNDITVEY